MSLYRSVAGLVRVELTGADLASSLDKVVGSGISVFALETIDEVTVKFTAERKNIKKLTGLVSKQGDRITVIGHRGLYPYLRSVLHRPVMLFGIPILVLLAMLIQSRILFVEVEGNETVPTRLILEAAADSGIHFGASRRAVRSEQVKNALLDVLPQLQWAGVNTVGCCAVISVRERPLMPEVSENNVVTSIVAAIDGVITSCTVTRGTGVCVPGQAVKAGETLISGYTDCGITIRATRAEGEIMAETRRELTVLAPSDRLIRVQSGEKKQRFSLIVGKKRINFYKGSGISGGSCVKMYSKYILTLPGGFLLPVALVTETVLPSTVVTAAASDPSSRMEHFAEVYLSGRMVCGRILSSETDVEECDGLYRLTGTFACSEMIGAEQYEMIGDLHGKANGTDR